MEKHQCENCKYSSNLKNEHPCKNCKRNLFYLFMGIQGNEDNFKENEND